MGFLDNFKKLFLSSKETPTVQKNDEYEKSLLIDQIFDLISKIKKINSFDSSIWNLANASRYELNRKSLDELIEMHSRLKSRLSELERKRQEAREKPNPVEKAKWTGRPTQGMSDTDLYRTQRGDDDR